MLIHTPSIIFYSIYCLWNVETKEIGFCVMGLIYGVNWYIDSTYW